MNKPPGKGCSKVIGFVLIMVFKTPDKLLPKTQSLYPKSQGVSNISLVSKLFILAGKFH
jgi:hypothetical protein